MIVRYEVVDEEGKRIAAILFDDNANIKIILKKGLTLQNKDARV